MMTPSRYIHLWAVFSLAQVGNIFPVGATFRAELADLLGVSRTWVYGRIRRGLIPAEFITRHSDYDRIFIRNDPKLVATLHEMKKNARSK
jgi:hypothetical protein